jgi:TonB family protein
MTLAILAHVAGLALFAWIVLSDRSADEPAAASAGASPAPSAAPGAASPAAIALLDVDVRAPAHPPAPAPGPGDQVGTGAAIATGAALDEPGARAADRGGGAPGGPAAWTGRRARADDALLRAEPWNGGDTYRSAHDDTRAPPATTEAIHRAPRPDTGDRQAGPVEPPGAPRGSIGAAAGQGAGAAPREPLAADPVLGAPAGASTPAGAARPGADRAAYADVGARAEDVQRHGAVGDDRAVAARSDATRPAPYDVTPPSAGGDDHGVRGRAGDGASPDGHEGAPGTASSHTDATAGDGGPTVTAAPEDPYFREFLRRLESAVVYPDDLRRDLRSGRVVASFRLMADGTIRDLRVEVHAPYAELDRALVAALRQLGTLGPVPSRLLRDGGQIRVRVPFVFSNPIIR